MNKVLKIIKREYLVRIKSRSFILATILTPIGIAAIIIGSIFITEMTKDSAQNVLILDEAGIIEETIESTNNTTFTTTDFPYDEAKKKYTNENYTIFIYIPPSGNSQNVDAQYLSKQKIGINAIFMLEEKLTNSFEVVQRKKSMIPDSVFNSFDVSVELENLDFVENQDANAPSKIKTMIGTALGGAVGFMMYIVIFLYGSMVMRSVMEEKTNRIVEVIISSVKPFQLLLGKLTGVSLVGLTQLLFWLIVIPILLFALQAFYGDASMMDVANMSGNVPQEELDKVDPLLIISEIQTLNWSFIIPIFIIFFIGGYFLYSSMYAAVGSAVGDDMGESQSLVFPIMIPVIFAFILLFPIIENPHGNLAIVCSIIPFFSPILMPARLAFEPPVWQVLLSILLLGLTVLGAIWAAARIYRVGILMYGKKVNFKEIGKWLFRG